MSADKDAQIQELEDWQRYALRRKTEALRRGNDCDAKRWDEIKADAVRAAAKLREQL